MNSKIIVALDFATMQQALDLAARLEPQQCKLKVGKELFTRGGPEIVTTLVEMGFDVFLDLKFHDIPNTVAKACLAAAELGVWMINIHASGGRNMMLAARESIDQYSADNTAEKPLLIAVTVLTSMTNSDLIDIGIATDPESQVNRLAVLAQQCGMDGVVCSPLEIASLRGQLGASFKLVTPGVRPVGANQDDQNRVMTPDAAVKEGADYLVIGRPIYQSNDPLQAIADINVNISTVLK